MAKLRKKRITTKESVLFCQNYVTKKIFSKKSILIQYFSSFYVKKDTIATENGIVFH